MSADRWSICPRCKVNAEANQSYAFDRAAEAYGQVPSNEYEKLRRDAQEPIELEETLRQDWDIFISDAGLFYIDYGASCSDCGFNHVFEHEDQLKVE